VVRVKTPLIHRRRLGSIAAGMIRASVPLFVFLLFLAVAAGPVVHAQAPGRTEKQKIEALIKYVADLNDATFVRNGRGYDAETAATFLRRKWEANDSKVKTARDFIDAIAAFSSTSGKPYMIRFKDGREEKSRDVLLAELNKMEKSSHERKGLGASSSLSAALRQNN
jgi:uncharacterized protein DUF5329